MKKRKRRGLRSFMAAALCFSLIFTQAAPMAYASQPEAGQQTLCEHHPAHNESCGYTEGSQGIPCTHEHTEECYALVTECVHEHTEDCYPAEEVLENRVATPSEPDEAEPTECTHECSEESGCITKKLNCQHEHDSECGYTPATEGTPCTYVCEICNQQDGGAQEQCSCITLCTEGNNNPDCPICSVEGADLTACKGKAEHEEKCTCETLCTEDNINHECSVCGEENADLTACIGKILVGVQKKNCTCIIPCTWYEINGDCPVCGEKDADLGVCQGVLEEEEPPAGTRIWVSTVDGTKTTYKNISCRYENKWGERLLVFEDIPIYYQSPDEVTFVAGTPFAGTTGSNIGASTSISLKDQSDFAGIDCWTAVAKGDKYGTPNFWFEFSSELAKVKLVIDAGEDGGEVSVTANNVASGYKCGSKHEDQIEAFPEKTDIALAMTDLGDGKWMAEGLLVPGSAPEISITSNEKTEIVSLADSFPDGFSEGKIHSAKLTDTSGNWSVSNVQKNKSGTWKAYLYTGDFWNRNGGELAPATICGAPVFMDERSSWGFTPETALTGKVTVPAHTETVQMKELFFSSPDNDEEMTFQEGSENIFLHEKGFDDWPTEVYFQTEGSSDWSAEPIALLPGETKTVLIRTYAKYYSIEITRASLETAVTINYGTETITFDDTVFEVNPNKQFTDSSIASNGSITDYIGQSIYIRVKAKADAPASGITEISIPARPAAPVGLTADNTGSGAADDGTITGLDCAKVYQYSKDGISWTDIPVGSSEITGLAAGSYYVRLAAEEEASFASVSAELTVQQTTTPVIPADTVRYIVEHYKADPASSTGYTLSDTEYPVGKIGDTVIAASKTYHGYTCNTEKSTARGELKEIKSESDILVLKLYYDLTEFTVTVETDGHGTAFASSASAVMGETITLTAKADSGYRFKEWETVAGGVSISGNQFVMPAEAVSVKAIFEKIPDGGEILGGGESSGGGNSSSDDSDSSSSSGTWSAPTGTWVQDSVGWWYRKTDGTYPVSCWQRLAYGKTVEWYRFDERGYMQTGWFTDAAGRTYYLHAVSDGRQGYMYTGWHQIDGKWYYFREIQDSTEGALYKNTRTPDGYMVDENGVWKP